MKLAVLGSGSRGNALALIRDGEIVLIDVGFGLRSMLRRTRTAGLGLERVRGIVLTHEHADHARGAGALARRLRCPVYASEGTLAALAVRLGGIATRTVPLRGEALALGPFRLTACRVTHDAAEPIAIRVEAAGWRVGIAYDLGRSTTALHHLLRESHCLVIEANHDEALLRSGPYPPVVQQRIAGAGGHLSNRAAAELVRALLHAGLGTVVLAHLSDRCNRPALAADAVWAVLRPLGFRGTVAVASQTAPLGPMDLGPPVQRSLELA